VASSEVKANEDEWEDERSDGIRRILFRAVLVKISACPAWVLSSAVVENGCFTMRRGRFLKRKKKRNVSVQPRPY